MAGPPLDLGDIQGDILRAYGNDYDCTSYAFVHIDCPPEQALHQAVAMRDRLTTLFLRLREQEQPKLSVLE